MENPGGIRTGKVQMLKGGLSDPRNKALMKMFNLIGIGERAGSGVLDIVNTWKNQGFRDPIVDEMYNPDRTIVTLPLECDVEAKSADNGAKSADNGAKSADNGAKSADNRAKSADNGAESANNGAESADNGAKSADNGAKTADNGAESADNGAKSADNGTETGNNGAQTGDKSRLRLQQILALMEDSVDYRAEEIAQALGLSLTRTKVLLRALCAQNALVKLGANRNRRYRKNSNG